MRKTLWIILTALVVTIGVPSAHADSFTVGTVTYHPIIGLAPHPTHFVFDNTTNAFTDFTVTGPGLDMFNFVPTGFSLADLSTSGFWTLTNNILTHPASPDTFLLIGAGSGTMVPSNLIGGLSTEPSENGTYTVVSMVVTPEPSSLCLTLLGIGFVMRKRRGQGISRAR